MPEANLYTVEQVAELLGVSDKSIYRWVAAGDLDAVRCGLRLLRFEPAAIDRFLAGDQLAA